MEFYQLEHEFDLSSLIFFYFVYLFLNVKLEFKTNIKFYRNNNYIKAIFIYEIFYRECIAKVDYDLSNIGCQISRFNLQPLFLIPLPKIKWCTNIII